MSILEDNKVIALFMGHKPKMLKAENISNPAIRLILGLDNDKNKTVLAVETKDADSLLYNPDKDWNQLMEAVEKIEKDHTYVSIFGRCCTIELFVDGVKVDAIVKQAETKTQAVYQAVLEYIKQQKEG